MGTSRYIAIICFGMGQGFVFENFVLGNLPTWPVRGPAPALRLRDKSSKAEVHLLVLTKRHSWAVDRSAHGGFPWGALQNAVLLAQVVSASWSRGRELSREERIVPVLLCCKKQRWVQQLELHCE